MQFHSARHVFTLELPQSYRPEEEDSQVNKRRTKMLASMLAMATGIASMLPRVFAIETYSEDLSLRMLPSGQVLSHFDFVTRIRQTPDDDADAYTHFNFFPRTIGQILSAFNVVDLHLTFTQSSWDYQAWGYPPLDSAGSGVELWAYLRNDGNVDANWKGVTNALSGLFCASINFVDETKTAEPLLSFKQQRPQFGDDSELVLRYGALPHENVCTENLTPWLKLLPCKTKSGLASLLDGHRLFDSDFHSMSVHVVKSGQGVEMHLSLETVLDIVRIRGDGKRDWSFDRLFGRSLVGVCPLAQTSLIRIQAPDEPFTIYPESIQEMAKARILNLQHPSVEYPLNLEMQYNESFFEFPMISPQVPVHITRSFGGYGQEHGNLQVEITNHLPHVINATYLDILPWFLKLYLHTMTMRVDSIPTKPLEIYYQLAVDRARPSVIEMLLSLPPQSTTTFSIDFDKVFLRYTEHPPDANRGFDVGSAVLTIGNGKRIYTSPLLVSLPTPDFSMPYNVIILTCTVIALFFGSSFNRLTRRFAVVDLDAPVVEDKSVVGRLRKVKGSCIVM